MKALVMAGGQGSRLRPLTCDRPKPMVPVCNQPVMGHILRLLARLGFDEVLVTLHPMPEVVQEHFGTGEAYGVRLRYLVEERPLGTAGGVARARPWVDETLVVVSGDALTDIDLQEALRFHRSRGSLATLVLKPVDDPAEYGIVITEPDGRIRRFLEKPARGEVFSDQANTGIYLLEPELLDRIPDGRAVDFSQELFPELLRKGEALYGWVATTGYWSDIGTPEQYRQAHLDLMGGWNPQEAVQVGPGCRVHPTARLVAPCLLGPGCEVEAEAEVGPFACLGEGCHVGAGASVRHSVLWKGCWLGPRAEVRGAVLADGVVLERGARIFEGAVLGRRCRVGEGATVGPGVRLWPEKEVDALEHLSRAVVWSGTGARAAVGPLGLRGEVNAALTPEAACGAGGAFAGRLPAGSRVVVAHSGGAAARALAWAAGAGVAAAGCDVAWLDTAPVGLARQAVRLAGRGGLYVATGSGRAVAGRSGVVGDGARHADGVAGAGPSGQAGPPGPQAGEAGGEGEEGVARLRLWDEQGLDLTAREARAVDLALRREEWRRAGAAGVGDIRSAFRLFEQARAAYLEALQAWCRAVEQGWGEAAAVLLPEGRLPEPAGGMSAAPGQAPVAVRWEDPVGPSPAEALLLQALEACGLAASAGPDTACGPPWMGVAVNPCGERAGLEDGRGRALPAPWVEDLACLVDALATEPGQAVALPVWAGQGVEQALRRMGREPVRAPGHPAALAGRRPGRLAHPLWDGIALACAVAAVARRAGGLEAVLRALGPGPRLRLELPVGHGRLGRVMRRLADSGRLPEAAAGDGLRWQDGSGWAVVRPDPDRPVVEVRVEAATLEDARDLLARCAELVRRSAQP